LRGWWSRPRWSPRKEEGPDRQGPLGGIGARVVGNVKVQDLPRGPFFQDEGQLGCLAGEGCHHRRLLRAARALGRASPLAAEGGLEGDVPPKAQGGLAWRKLELRPQDEAAWQLRELFELLVIGRASSQ